MNRYKFLFTTSFLSVLLSMSKASALTMEEFSNICNTLPVECSQSPVMNAYVGGALDLVATLGEQTNYLQPIYCKDPKDLFDIPVIINYMEQHSQQYEKNNAMLVLVKYFEEHGAC